MNHRPDDPGIPPFTPEQAKHLRDIADRWEEYESIRQTVERSQWLGRLIWRTGLVIGGMTAGLIAFQGQVKAILGWIKG